MVPPAQRIACAAVIGASLVLAASRASADPAWIDRRLTLSQGEWGVDLGVGIADDARDSIVGTGAYGQIHYGITDRVEIEVRDGVRFGVFGRYSHAEQYGRLYTTDGSVVPAPGPVANPDLVVVGRVLELAAEGEISVPIELNTHVATTAGLEVTLHGAPWVRFDTGVFVTATFLSPVEESYDIPLELWFQPTRFPLWFGPLTALRTVGATGTWTIPLGFGVGYAVTKDIDVRAEVLVPQINMAPGVRDMGAGVGAQWRF